MKYKTKEIDINKEYEKLVPPTERKSLFDESEDYEGLRKYIMAQPVTILHKPKLPFSDVKILDSSRNHCAYLLGILLNMRHEMHETQ